MKYNYDTTVKEPRLLLSLHISNLIKSKKIKVNAIIDTGASISAIPKYFISKLDLFPTRKVQVTGFTGEKENVYKYLIKVFLTSKMKYEIEVIPSKRDYFIIGRDILNRMKLIADGPNRKFSLK